MVTVKASTLEKALQDVTISTLSHGYLRRLIEIWLLSTLQSHD